MKNILLLVSYFPPDNHVGSWRWGRLSKELVKKNCRIHVISSHNKNDAFYEWNEFNKYASISRIKKPYNTSIRYNYSKLKSYFNFFDFKRSLNTTFKKAPSQRKYDELSNLGKIRRFISLLIDFPDFSWSSSKAYYYNGSQIIKDNKIDIIIASHPYVGCLRAAKKLSNKYNIPWVADMRDGWSGNLFSPYSEFKYLFKLLKIQEKRLLSTSSAVVVINKQLANYILCDKNKIKLISNAFTGIASKNNERIYNSKLFNKKNHINIVFSGGIKSDHNFYKFLDAIKKFNEVKGDFIRFHYYGKRFDMLKFYSNSICLNENVLIDHGYVSIKDIDEANSSADLLVIFGWLGRCSETYQTGKIFDYLKSGKPIIGIDNKNSALSDTIEKCNVGLVSSNSDEICDFLLKIYENNHSIEKLISKFNYQEINKFSVSETSESYLSLINKVTS